MQTSETVKELFKAMISVAPEIQSISKSKQAYGYKYATLDSLIDMLRSVLPKHGIWFTQIPSRNGESSMLTTRVFHISGEWIEDSIEMTDTELQGKANDTQKVGASITYYRRYALSSIFCVAADEDVDGNLNNVRKQETPKTQPQKKQDPMPFLLQNIKSRIESGETKESILKSYADILKTDDVRELDGMTDIERSTIARFIYVQNQKEK